MTVDTLTGVTTPTHTAENLVGLGALLGPFKKISPLRANFIVMTSNGLLYFGFSQKICNETWDSYLNKTHVVCRDVKPPEHSFLTPLHQHAPVAVPSEEVNERRGLVGETALELGVRVRLAILEIHGPSLQTFVLVVFSVLSRGAMGSWCQHGSNVGCRDGLLTDANARDVDLAPAPAPQTREGGGQTPLGLSRLGLGAEVGHVVGEAGGPELAVGSSIDMGADVLDSGEQVIHFAAQIFVRVLQVLVPLAELETASEVEQIIVGDWETFRPFGL